MFVASRIAVMAAAAAAAAVVSWRNPVMSRIHASQRSANLLLLKLDTVNCGIEIIVGIFSETISIFDLLGIYIKLSVGGTLSVIQS